MFPFYFIADPSVLSGTSLLKTVTDAMDGGARLIQYRDKNSARKTLYENAKRLRTLTSQRSATLIINDHIDIALAVEADGVHLGQSDLPLWAARKILGNRLVGISTHTLAEAIEAEQEGADYIGFGPVFATRTKADAKIPVGVEAITQIKKRVQIPLYAIGGVTYESLPSILAAGADGVAAISAVLGNVRAHVEQWVKAF
jgi:thiamine-phosphate pyrophosphorylase